MVIEPQKSALERRYTRYATTYSQVGPGIFPYFGRRLVEFAGVPPGACVLDAACGRGASLFPAAEQVGPGGLVTGVDLSAGMAAETRREIRANQIFDAHIAQADAEYLPFPDSAFDFVLCSFALFYFPDLPQALAEFRRVLKDGGQAVVSTWTPVRDERWSWLRPLAGEYLPPEEAEDLNSAPDYGTAAGLSAILAGAGFRDARAETVPHEFVYRDETEWWETGWAAGQYHEMEQWAGHEGIERFKAEAFARLRDIKSADGLPQRITAVFAAGVR